MLQRMTSALTPYFHYIRERFAGICSGLSGDRFFWLLVTIFTLLFLPHAFVLVEDIGLISGYEADPGSHVRAIEDLLRTYNMHAGYHSRYYGWTYFCLNFWLLLPIHWVSILFGLKSKFALYFGIRFILFCMGLFSAVAFYAVLKHLFKSRYLPFIGTLFYMFSPCCLPFFYTIHPETTGLFFILVGVLVLFDFIEKPHDHRAYIIGLVSLVLASLSKHTYFFAALPVLFLFFHYYCVSTNMTYWARIRSQSFGHILAYTIAISMGLFFIIHPFAFIQVGKFIAYQTEFGDFTHGPYAEPLAVTLDIWYQRILTAPFLAISLALLPVTLVVSLYGYRRRYEAAYFLSCINALAIGVVFTLIITQNRYLFMVSYLQPIYPFLIIHILSMVVFVKNISSPTLRYTTKILAFYALFFLLAQNMYTAIPASYNRLTHKDAIAFLTYEYITKTLTEKDILAHDHYVAVPAGMGDRACHYWQACGTDAIEAIAPNIVMFNESYSIRDHSFKGTERLKQYVKEHDFRLIKKFTGEYFTSAATETITVSVYKKNDAQPALRSR